MLVEPLVGRGYDATGLPIAALRLGTLGPQQRVTRAFQDDDLRARGVTIEATPIARLDGHADVVLADGRRLRFAGLFTAPRNAPATSIAQGLGCALMDTPMGTQLQTADSKETTVPGVFACGDVARMPHSVSLAVGDGAWAGAQLHRSLVWPEG